MTYIGFSQGTAQAFGGLSINPEMNEKVNLFIAMAPAASPKGFSHPLLDGFVKAAPSIIYCLLGRKIFLKSVVFWQRIISPPIFVKLIDGAVHFLFGWHCKNMSQDQKLVSYQHLFSMTSVKSIVVSEKKGALCLLEYSNPVHSIGSRSSALEDFKCMMKHLAYYLGAL